MEQTEKNVLSKKFGLDELIPMDAEITIGGKTYELRKINILDEAWLKQFGNIQSRFNAEDLDFMCKLAFRLLKDKSDFLPVDATDHDDDGNEIMVKKTGPMRIAEAVSGAAGKLELIQALNQTFGISRPMFEQLLEENLKKNTEAMNQANQTGEKSLT